MNSAWILGIYLLARIATFWRNCAPFEPDSSGLVSSPKIREEMTCASCRCDYFSPTQIDISHISANFALQSVQRTPFSFHAGDCAPRVVAEIVTPLPRAWRFEDVRVSGRASLLEVAHSWPFEVSAFELLDSSREDFISADTSAELAYLSDQHAVRTLVTITFSSPGKKLGSCGTDILTTIVTVQLEECT